MSTLEKHLVLTLLACTLLVACDEPEPPQPPVTRYYNQGLLPFLYDESGNWLLIDTGSPRTQIHPETLGLPDSTFGELELPDWDLAELNPAGGPLLVSSELPPLLREEIGLTGIIGFDLLGQHRWTLDPRNSLMHFGDPAGTLVGTEPPFEIPILPVGAGRSCLQPSQCYNYGASRLLVEVEIEGFRTHALVDTGSTYMMTTSSFMTRLAESNRPVVVFEGAETTTYSRFASIHVGSAQLHNPAIVVDDNLAEGLARLHVETGTRVDMLLGLSFLSYFATEFDHTTDTLRLHPYAEVDHVTLDIFVSFGVQLVADDDCFVVQRVASSHVPDLKPGDCVEHVMGHYPEEGLEAVNVFLEGLALGDSFSVGVRRDTGSIDDVELRVMDLLPPIGL